MADILKITSAAVDSLLSGQSSNLSDKSFGKQVRLPGKSVREISMDEVLRRSTLAENSLNLASFLNRPSTDEDSKLNRGHRTVSPSKSAMVASFTEDESKHLIAPSTDSSEYVSIIDVGKSMSSSDSSKDISDSIMGGKSLERDEVDLIPVKDNENSSKNTSSSTVSSLKSSAVVDSSTPNSKLRPHSACEKSKDSNGNPGRSVEEPITPDLSEYPPALPALNIPRRGLQQGSLDSFEKNEIAVENSADVEIKKLDTKDSASARNVLQSTATQSRRGTVPIQRNKPGVVAPEQQQAVSDHTSQIAAAVAAAVAATTPFFQLKSEIEEKLQKLSSDMLNVAKQDGVKIPNEDNVIADEQAKLFQEQATNDSLDITLIPDMDDRNVGVPTPVQPRIAPKPRSLRKPQDSSRDSQNFRKPKSARELRSQFIKSADSDSTIHTLSDNVLEGQCNEPKTKEYSNISEDILQLLKEAKEAKREIEEMRHAERIQAFKSSVYRDKTPADIYLERIQERENRVIKQRHIDEKDYRTPEYITHAKNTLAEIEEQRKQLEERNFLLDRTYCCEEKEPEDEEISNRIDQILNDIQKEIRSRDPKKMNIAEKQIRAPKRSKVKNKLEEKKIMYERIKAENQKNVVTANIGLLKKREKEIKSQHMPKTNRYQESPYKRPDLPKSYPLVPQQTSIIHEPSTEQLHSTPLPTKSQKSIQTSPIVVEQLTKPPVKTKPRPAVATRDVSVCNSPEIEPLMIDQYSSPLKVLTHEKSQNYSPQFLQSYNHIHKGEARNNMEDDGFIEVLDLPGPLEIQGMKGSLYQDRFPVKTSSVSKIQEPIEQCADVEEDKIVVMRWLEDEIISKMLAEEAGIPHEGFGPHNDYLGVNIASLDLNLSSDELHLLVSDVIRSQIEERANKCSLTRQKDETSPDGTDGQSADERLQNSDIAGKQEYDESFESSPSQDTRSSLSIVPTPSITDNRSISAASSDESSNIPQNISPVMTPSLSPDPFASSIPVLPEGVPLPPTEKLTKNPPLTASFFNDTIEQVPLDVSEEVVGDFYVETPDFTDAPRDFTLSDTTGVQDRLTKRSLITPLNTATIVIDPANSIISQHPLGDTGDVSLMSQHPLDETIVLEPHHESSGSDSAGLVEDSTSSYTCTDTADLPISAGEVLPVKIPREIADLDCVVDRPLSEGEWPLSPTSIDLLQLVKDPDMRQLFEDRCTATVKFVPHAADIKVRREEPISKHVISQPESSSQNQKIISLSSHEKQRKNIPSPLPRPQSNEHTLELVTPLPETPAADPFNSPSPPPFLGLKLEDYAYSGESVTKSDASNDSF